MKKIIISSIIVLLLHLSLFVQETYSQWTQTSLQNISMECLSNCFGNIYAGTIDSGIYITTNNGLNWTKSFIINQRIWRVYQFGNRIFAGTNMSGVYVSIDSGRNWTQTSLNNISVSSFTSDGNNLYAGCTSQNAIFKSSNNGNSWNQIPMQGGTRSLAYSGNNLIASVSLYSPGGLHIEDIYYSTNQGVIWNNSNINGHPWYFMVKDNIVFAGMVIGFWYINYGVKMSTDNGISWTHLTSFNNKNVYSLGYFGNYLFAATFDQGVYTSNNNFSTWRRINEGLTDTITNGLLIKDSYIFVGTANHGVWRRPLSEITSANNISIEIPSTCSLSQNFPNPFNPVTRIRYDLPRSGSVRLAVYDVMGREVEMLVNERQAEGTYEATFDGSRFASGVYFYRLTAEGFNETRKMLLIR
jgi:hypothetical protein